MEWDGQGEPPVTPEQGRSLAKGLKRIVKGAAGTAKYMTGRGRVSPEVYEARAQVCRGCNDNIHREADGLGRCGPLFSAGENCACVLRRKLKLANAHCPLNKWGKDEQQ